MARHYHRGVCKAFLGGCIVRNAIVIALECTLIAIVILGVFLAIIYVGFEPVQRAEENRFKHHHIYH